MVMIRITERGSALADLWKMACWFGGLSVVCAYLCSPFWVAIILGMTAAAIAGYALHFHWLMRWTDYARQTKTVEPVEVPAATKGEG